jgi:hypothetical protein
MVTYTKEDIVSAVEKILLKNPENLYRDKVINYTSKWENGEKYSEAAAAEILRNLERLNSISVLTRKSTYRIASHDGKATTGLSAADSNQEEAHIALSLFGKKLSPLGTINDYQTPLKNSQKDNAGKIDLLAYNSASNSLYILELKKPASTETLLRAVLEIYTYWRIVNIQKLLYDFGLPSDTVVRKAVLAFQESQAYADRKDVYTGQLMEKLGVELYILNDKKTGIIEQYPQK